jgi:MGT family glycosyltransferase
MQDFFVDFLLPSMVADLIAIARSWNPDVVVRDPLEFGGCLAAEVLRLPHAACGPLYCLWDGARHLSEGETAKPQLDGLRRRYGLPPDPDLVMLHRHLYLALLPPSFIGPGLRVPSTVRFLQPVSFNQSGAERLPDWMARLSKQPTVHATLGTVQHRTPGVFATILEALQGEAMNVILTVGRDQDPAQFGPQPDNVRIERYIPHSLLLPACDAVITHGGFSSVIACLNAGVPMVFVPISGDQPGNAERCAALGTGRVITAAERKPAPIRAAVWEVLSEHRYRENAERVRDEMQALPEIRHAVSLLEQLAAEIERPS